MQKNLIIAMAMAVASLGTVSSASAQPVPPPPPPAMDHDRLPPRGPGRFVPVGAREQLHDRMAGLDKQIADAARDRRISFPESRTLRGRVGDLQRMLYTKARRGISQNEFDDISRQADRLRGDFDAAMARGPRH